MKNKEKTFKCSNELFLRLFTISASLLLLVLLSMVSIFLLPSGSAHATTVFDESLKNQSYPLTIRNEYNGESNTVSSAFNFGEKLVSANTLDTCNSSHKTNVLNSITNGDKYVIISYNQGSLRFVDIVVFQGDVTQTWNPADGEGQVSLSSPLMNVYKVSGFNSNLSLTTCYQVTSSEYSLLLGSKFSSRGIMELSAINLDYPDGYAGVIITPVAPPASTAVPDLNILTGTGYQVVIQDRNFNTFDQVPFLCNSETTPVMYYELWKGADLETDVKLTEGLMSPTVPFNYGLPTGADTYRYVAWYSCGTGDIIFSESTQKEFQINQFGSLVQECQDDISGFICTMNEGFNLGIFSTTFNGLVDMLGLMKTINPTYCNTNWIATSNFESDLFPVQNFPPELCSRALQLYIAPTAPYHTFTLWVNILLQGSAILLLVFGLLSIFGFKVRLPSPLEDEADDGTSIRPDIETSSSISRHRATYSKGKR